ncbi:hypothetical protein JCM19275_1402 [Nonlabens ulvanivorans]|uniref:Uncharacterized protein n=1 Tax=Nonlabens ulvanivorans TaxID=906888 RepID=A0A090WJ73_NONUL|nr:hypothetical protein [Nonlabens ulvanivorans]GAL77110.1 hypothetical protein JCM19275_1402 [Nonlabens ulvanivorans]
MKSEPKRHPTEFAINMYLDKMMILQQSELKVVNDYNYFDENSPCHIYFVCRRPRVIIDPTKFSATKKTISLHFKIQKKDKFIDFPLDFENPFKDENITVSSQYPFSTFQFKRNEETLLNAKTAVFLQSFERHHTKAEFLDLEILYIGQSYGVDGARTAPDRLKSHSTLQGIYSTAIEKNPDFEIWLMLASFEQLNIMMMDGRTKYTDEEIETDKERFIGLHNKLNYEGINEQQKINFTEAALIRYFEPQYNIEYKNSFPNPAHKTYAECYELDINSVAIELETIEKANFKLFSHKIKPNWLHIKTFMLHSKKDRKDMFEILPKG